MFARPDKAASATDMLKELMQCRAGKAADLSIQLFQDQQRTITALEQRLEEMAARNLNHELWQRKTDKT